MTLQAPVLRRTTCLRQRLIFLSRNKHRQRGTQTKSRLLLCDALLVTATEKSKSTSCTRDMQWQQSWVKCTSSNDNFVQKRYVPLSCLNSPTSPRSFWSPPLPLTKKMSMIFFKRECKGVSVQCVNKTRISLTQSEKWAQLAQPRVAKNKSGKKGVTPPTPRVGLRPRREDAKARAGTQPTISAQRILQACSTRRHIKALSLRALAATNNVKNVAVSVDHLPPTSSANTTNFALLRGPTGSG